MTVCVPRKPFVTAWNVFKAFCIVSWIPYSVLCAIWFEASRGIILAGWSIMVFPLIYSLLILYDKNEEKHWFQWCDKSKKQEYNA